MILGKQEVEGFFKMWFKNNGIFEVTMFISVLLLTTSVDIWSLHLFSYSVFLDGNN